MHISRLTVQGLVVVLAMLEGPSLAAIIVTRIADGQEGLRRLVDSWGRWRAGGRWYAALLLTPLVLVVVLGPLMLLSDGFTLGVLDEDGGLRLLVLGISYALMGPAFEETGWAGFAQSRLLERRSMLTAGLLLGVIHARLLGEF